MSKKKPPTPEEHLARLRTSEGKRVEYSARTHKGKGKINQVYDGLKGAWVTIMNTDGKVVTVRPTQVKFF